VVDVLLDFAVSGRGGSDEIRAVLSKFEALHPYLKLISEANGIEDVFDYDVAEAFWIGSKLLENVSTPDLKDMVVTDFGRYLPTPIARYFAASTPDGMFPHHSFHVLHIHSVTGRVKDSVENRDSCRISWGKVVGVGVEECTVEYQPLKRGNENNNFFLGEPREKNVALCVNGRNLGLEISGGDNISFHWGAAVEVLSRDKLSNLIQYTQHTINLLNENA